MPEPWMCIDRIKPPSGLAARLALLNDKKWERGDVIQVSFLDGSPALRQRVRDCAQEWSQYANVRFAFVDRRSAEIRIAFSGRGSWSYIGTTCRDIRAPEPTMSFGWLADDSPDEVLRRVVLHEFGHALGAVHEHQNPAGGIPWAREAVYTYYGGPPNNWSRAEVDTNIFQTYARDLTSYTQVDVDSIMMYPIDPQLTLNGFSVGLNGELSVQDKAFIGQVYYF